MSEANLVPVVVSAFLALVSGIVLWQVKRFIEGVNTRDEVVERHQRILVGSDEEPGGGSVYDLLSRHDDRLVRYRATHIIIEKRLELVEERLSELEKRAGDSHETDELHEEAQRLRDLQPDDIDEGYSGDMHGRGGD